MAMHQQPVSLTENSIRACIQDPTLAQHVYYYDCLDSTNNEAKRLIAGAKELPLLVVAETQTAGKGRLGRSFYSPAGSGVYLSLAFDGNAQPLRATTAAAVAVVRAITELTALPVQIKWVNDIYLYDKKICGILAEAVTDTATGRIAQVVVGIGINVTTQAFPEELSDRAGALDMPNLSRPALIAGVAEHLLSILNEKTPHAYMDEYRAHSMVIGKRVRYCQNNGEVFHATALGVDDEGGLMVEHDDGVRQVLRTGEITLRLDPPACSG